jgi:hypothetical protein
LLGSKLEGQADQQVQDGLAAAVAEIKQKITLLSLGITRA